MRIFKLVGAALSVLAIMAFAATTAFAEEVLWKWLPGKAGERFKGGSGKLKWQIEGGGAIECKSITLGAKVGELLEEGSTEGKDATLALAIFVISGCKTLGLSMRGLADEKETVTMHTEIHTCLISPGDFALLIKLLPVHIEVEETSLLFVFTGSFIALVEREGTQPTKNWKLNIKQKEGKQEIEKCEGGTAQSVETSTDGSADSQTGLEAKGFVIEFEKAAQEAMT